MIRTLHRTRGASTLGARHDGEPGPFGVRGIPADPDDDDEEQPHDDDQDDSKPETG